MTFTLAKRKSNVPIVIIFPQYDITQKSIQGFPKKETNIHILHTTKSKVCKLRLSHTVRVWPSALYLTREGSCHTNICKLGSIHFGSIRRGSSVASGSLAPSSPLRNDCRTRFKCDIWLPGAFSSTSGRLSHAVRVALSFFLGGFVPFYGKQVDLGRICPFLLGTD